MFRLMAFASIAGLALASSAAEVGMAETWPADVLQGWTALDHAEGIPATANLDVVDGELRLKPDADPHAMLNPRWSFRADSGSSDGHLSGSLYEVGAHTLRFDFYTSVPVALSVQWINQAEFIFYGATVAVSASAGRSTLEVRLDPDHFQPDFFGSDALFEALIRNTDEIWITMDWDKAEPSPEFRIDNVGLAGAGAGYGAWADWNGGSLRDRLPGYDPDNDQCPNAGEFAADTLPYEDSSRLMLIPGETSGSCAWLSSTNCSYTLLRSTNLLTHAFGPVLSGQPGTGAAMGYAETEDLPQAFYLLKAERN